MSIGAELGQYILQTQLKKFWRFNGGGSLAYLKLRQEWTTGWS